jgi:hypothetical protein
MTNEHAYNPQCNCLRCVNIYKQEEGADMFWSKQKAIIDATTDAELLHTKATHVAICNQITLLTNSKLEHSYKTKQLSKLYKWKNEVEHKLLSFMSSPFDAA